MANAVARRLRKTMTPQEVKLWVHLRSWKNRGYHFRRQCPRDGYILDFACLPKQLIVEVDGGQHNSDQQLIKDKERDDHFRELGFRVLRFWNSDIDKNLPGVLESIDAELRAVTPTRPANAGHPPPSGEG
jgi:very-short-patch-repair endonuclease